MMKLILVPCCCIGSLWSAEMTLPKLVETESRLTADRWDQRRQELLTIFEQQVYGKAPDQLPEIVFQVEESHPVMDGKARLKQVKIVMSYESRRLIQNLTLFVPENAKKPVPTFLLICHRNAENIDPTRTIKRDFWPAEVLIEKGYAAAAFHVADIDPDHKKDANFTDGVHALYKQALRDDSWGTLAAWSWGASRAMDYFENDDDIDANRVAVVGHSRGGKSALWAGATDQRFALSISNDSGCGGAALSRRKMGERVKRINDKFPHWFCRNFRHYNNREDQLPIDQHQLIALMAPRAVYIASASRDAWADPVGEYLSLYHASLVWTAYGFSKLNDAIQPPVNTPRWVGPLGYHLRQGKHNLTLYDWTQYIAFADKLFSDIQK